MNRFFSILPILFVAVVLAARSADACPMCTEALENGKSASSQDLPRGVYYSVLFMLSMPFVLTGSFGFAFYRLNARRSLQSREDSIPTSFSENTPASKDETLSLG
ncbi:MAG: hypothetical protein U1D30_17095 [Planctomycetota bacterium]